MGELMLTLQGYGSNGMLVVLAILLILYWGISLFVALKYKFCSLSFLPLFRWLVVVKSNKQSKEVFSEDEEIVF